MKFEIKHKITGAVLFVLETESLKVCVEAAIKSRADLSGANLSRAYLSGAYLSGADLSRANLSRAYLSGAYLSRAYLSGANLSGADLSGANLSGANLSGADLSRAYLSRADLSGANLSRAANAERVIAYTRILPDGQIIGWKKGSKGEIIKLSIPADAKRSHAFGRKCRCEFADVLEISSGAKIAINGTHDKKIEYRVGERVTADKWDEDFTNECSHGIHFFITRIEAEDWQ